MKKPKFLYHVYELIGDTLEFRGETLSVSAKQANNNFRQRMHDEYGENRYKYERSYYSIMAVLDRNKDISSLDRFGDRQ